VLVGMGVDLDVRALGLLGRLGKFKYLQVNVYARSELTETAKNGFRDMQVTVAAGYPLQVGGARFLIDGYFDWNLGFDTGVMSFHINPQLKLDLGHLFWNAPEKLYAGVELDFWWNKFKIRSTPEFGTNQYALSFLIKYHF
jgi:nucleoside-specific outer membrane channel protein Tsx